MVNTSNNVIEIERILLIFLLIKKSTTGFNTIAIITEKMRGSIMLLAIYKVVIIANVPIAINANFT